MCDGCLQALSRPHDPPATLCRFAGTPGSRRQAPKMPPAAAAGPAAGGPQGQGQQQQQQRGGFVQVRRCFCSWDCVWYDVDVICCWS